ncbi:MAG: 3-deoxy-manno-octulosonate cytidylyltransferase [Planctomycetes bacterium]|nr:3-deoxy-manno-octulosonate cytidylyltransferase [Planctomycetota bacterium]MBI3835485.1 3-deoxy-manno-octulosonate cytidylyltransferase [Planctomycetota bacterium]
MTVVAVIPARMAAVRFPGKPLANKTGKPMIQHVFERVRSARRIDRIVVATDDERILQAVKSFDGEARMTRADHVSGTDRVGEVADSLKLADDDLVLNVQGDEPEIESTSLDKLVERMMNAECGMLFQSRAREEAVQAQSSKFEVRSSKNEDRKQENHSYSQQQITIGTIAAPFDDNGPKEGPGSPLDPNCVKVVVDLSGCAMYFSRSPIPFPRDTKGLVDRPSRWLLHMGVYAFRCETLRRLTGGRMKPSVLERAESLEQLRWLENGYSIAVEIVEHRSVGIDTPEDYEAFVRRFRAATVRERI